MSITIRPSTTASTQYVQKQAHAEKQQAINAGTRKASTGEIASVLDIKRPIAYFGAQIEAALENVIDNNNFVSSIIVQQDQAIGTMIKEMTRFVEGPPGLKQVLTPEGGEAEAMRAQAYRLLETLQGLLNEKSGTIFLFGGDDSTIKPVNNLTTIPSNPGGVPSMAYYQGGLQTYSTILDPTNISVLTDITTKADHEAIRDAIACVAEARDNNFDAAYTRGVSAVTKLAHLQQDLRTRAGYIKGVNEALTERLDRNRALIAEQAEFSIDQRTEITEQQQDAVMSQLYALDIRSGVRQVMQRLLSH